MRTQKKGFTLVEIMIVVVIISLLAVLAVPAFNRVRATAQESIIKNNLRQIAHAADEYFIKEGVSQVTVTALIGNDSYIKTIKQVADEDYTAIGTIDQDYTQITVSVPALEKSVVYDQ